MESVVTISLEEYTKIILEKQKMELELIGLKKKLQKRIDEEIKDGLIDALDKEETVKYLNSEPSVLLSKFGTYSWKYSGIAEECLIVSEEEVKQMSCETIVRMLNYHLKDLLESEKDNQNK